MDLHFQPHVGDKLESQDLSEQNQCNPYEEECPILESGSTNIDGGQTLWLISSILFGFFNLYQLAAPIIYWFVMTKPLIDASSNGGKNVWYQVAWYTYWIGSLVLFSPALAWPITYFGIEFVDNLYLLWSVWGGFYLGIILAALVLILDVLAIFLYQGTDASLTQTRIGIETGISAAIYAVIYLVEYFLLEPFTLFYVIKSRGTESEIEKEGDEEETSTEEENEFDF